MAEKLQDSDFRCGMVSIVGRPNVGKSTLLNKLLGEKVAIVSNVPQTTRNQIRGIYNDERGQIVFIDTPGLHMTKDKLDKFMNNSAYGSAKNAECVIHLVDSGDVVGKEEEEIVGRLSSLNIPVILGLNKVDVNDRYVPDYIALWERVVGKPATEIKSFVILPLSGKTGIHMDKLFNTLFEFLPPGPALYPRDALTDIPQRMMIADIVREKLFDTMRHELPYALAVIVEDMQPKRKKTLHIRILIVVERESQKMIVIGKGGQVLKKAGTLARLELEQLLEHKVFLEMHVKNKKKWRDDNALLQEMGYYS